jgi:hypothetical protein
MNRDTDIMRRVMQKYGLANPIDEASQVRALKKKRKIFTDMLRKLGIYTPVYTAIISIYYLFKNLGMGLTVFQSTIALAIITSATALSIGVGGYAAVTIIVSEHRKTEQQKIKPETLKRGGSDSSSQSRRDTRTPTTTASSSQLYFPLLECGDQDLHLARDLHGHIRRGLATGLEITASPGDADFLLTGSLDKLDGHYLLTIRLTDRVTRKILYAVSEESSSIDGLKSLSNEVARMIHETVR